MNADANNPDAMPPKGEAKGAGKGSTSEGWSRHEAIADGAFPMFIDPNRPKPYRRSDNEKAGIPNEKLESFRLDATKQQGRLSWATPRVTPFRFYDPEKFEDEADLEDAFFKSFEDEKLIRRLDPAEYFPILDNANELLRKGVRIERAAGGCGCWIPVDGQIANNRYRGTYGAVYAVKNTPPKADEAAKHNGADDPDDEPEQPEQRYSKYYYRCPLIADLSHVCHNPLCIRPDHICLELKIINTGRQKCDGPGQDGFCKCMKAFARSFFQVSEQSSPEAFAEACRRVPHCLRRSRDVEEIQRTDDEKKTIKRYRAFSQADKLLVGPWEATPRGKEPMMQSREVVKARCKAAVDVLFDTGFRFMRFPYAFIDVSPLDEFIAAVNKSKGVSGKGVYSTTGSGTTLTGRMSAWWFSTLSSVMRRLADRYESIVDARRQAVEDYMARKPAGSGHAQAAQIAERGEEESQGAELYVDEPASQELKKASKQEKKRKSQEVAEAAAEKSVEAPSPIVGKSSAPKPIGKQGSKKLKK